MPRADSRRAPSAACARGTSRCWQSCPVETRHSDDLRYWWDGERWFPAVSANGRWWFDGTRWRPNRRRGARALVIVAFVAVLAWPVMLMVNYMALASTPEYPGQPVARWAGQFWYVVAWWPALIAALVIAGTLLTVNRPVKRTD